MKLMSASRVTDLDDLQKAVHDCVAQASWCRTVPVHAHELLAKEPYRVELWRKELTDGSFVYDFRIRPETPAETKREEE